MSGARTCPADLQDVFVGDHVEDRDADDDGDAATLLVVATPPQDADEYAVGDDATVADYNEDYPSDDAVIEVVYAQRTCVDIDNTRRYAFPRSRLQLTEPAHDLEAEGDD
ncbi:hypothetical protein [Haloarcula sp. CBA1127]|uniref:hypothetical protein n=1 Tax=Haloarcula sp. CBA1127 TaxID=1765055 RepID=UPI00073E3173|nr:hypothetical protein [Haloarcula sp. CBA1127]